MANPAIVNHEPFSRHHFQSINKRQGNFDKGKPSIRASILIILLVVACVMIGGQMPNSVRIPFAWLLKRLGPHDTVVVAKLIPRDKNNVIHSNRMQYFQSIWDTEDPSHLIVTLLWFCIVVLYNSMVQEHDLFLNLFGEYCHVTIVSVAESDIQAVLDTL